VALPWFEIIKELERNPHFLHQLDWRKVEELVAGAYKQDGWPDVTLTRRSGDGGRDIIARKPGSRPRQKNSVPHRVRSNRVCSKEVLWL